MNVFMYLCLCVCLFEYMCIYPCIYISIYICVCVCMLIRQYQCLSGSLLVCLVLFSLSVCLYNLVAKEAKDKEIVTQRNELTQKLADKLTYLFRSS